MPKISVIIPVHNGEAHLSASIESVLQQTCRDFEIIIVDDGSTDRTGIIGRQYARAYPDRIACLHQDNRGPGAARNTGLKAARGEYIAFLDADDLWVPSKLEKQAAVLDRKPGAGLVYTDISYLDEHGRTEGHGVLHGKYPLPRGSIPLFFFFRYFLVTSSVMVRSSIARAAGFFREDINVGEDADYLLRVSALCAVEVLEEDLTEKRYRKESLSHLDESINERNFLHVRDEFLRNDPVFFAKHKRVLSHIMGKRSLTLAYRSLRDGHKALAFPLLLKAMRYEPSLKAIRYIIQLAIPFSLLRLAGRIARAAGRKPAPETQPRALR